VFLGEVHRSTPSESGVLFCGLVFLGEVQRSAAARSVCRPVVSVLVTNKVFLRRARAAVTI
jgi:hypothetical protein